MSNEKRKEKKNNAIGFRGEHSKIQMRFKKLLKLK
jgi:hypothetical protein